MPCSFSQLSNGIVIFITWSAEAAVADNQQDRNHGELEHCRKVLMNCCLRNVVVAIHGGGCSRHRATGVTDICIPRFCSSVVDNKRPLSGSATESINTHIKYKYRTVA